MLVIIIKKTYDFPINQVEKLVSSPNFAPLRKWRFLLQIRAIKPENEPFPLRFRPPWKRPGWNDTEVTFSQLSHRVRWGAARHPGGFLSRSGVHTANIRSFPVWEKKRVLWGGLWQQTETQCIIPADFCPFSLCPVATLRQLTRI